jgi:putative transposase
MQGRSFTIHRLILLCRIKMAARRSPQLALEFRTWGGRRKGAGRKPAKKNVGLLPHLSRPKFDPHVPVHATLRALRGTPKMRAQSVMQVIYDEIAKASAKGFRLIDFSVQEDHLHLLAEADDARSLSRGMQRLAARIARRLNMLVGRRGKFWKERYHRRDLSTPKQFRNALVHVVNNFRKHAPAGERGRRARVVDGHSSAMWLDGWKDESLRERLRVERTRAGPRPTALPRTWIARVGWKRHGLIDPRESPRSPG